MDFEFAIPVGMVGAVLGVPVLPGKTGALVGFTEGPMVGAVPGACVLPGETGALVGLSDGPLVGAVVGIFVLLSTRGSTVTGALVGVPVGPSVGGVVGSEVGLPVGPSVGGVVGSEVGLRVGSNVALHSLANNAFLCGFPCSVSPPASPLPHANVQFSRTAAHASLPQEMFATL